MNGIYLVSLHDVLHHANDEGLCLFVTRIEIALITVGQKPIGMFAGDVIGGDRGAVDVEYSAVGIQPGVEFHAAFVCFLDHELKRIVERNGCLSLFAGEEFTPGFKG